MKHQLRSAVCTEGRRMAGARALWVANGMKREQFGKPIIAIVNSFTQFVPGHTHLHEAGQIVKAEIESLGCYAAEFNTIAIDDGIAMGHDGMLYSLPSRDIIADSVEYMCNAHKADAMVCISNCDKITPGMLMAAMRLNIPAVFVSGGPMEAGKWKGENLDLIAAMIKGADPTVGDDELAEVENRACPGCGCCSGMFTEIESSGRSGCSERNWQTLRITIQLISSISPFFSASGINSPGEINTPSSFFSLRSDSPVQKLSLSTS